MNIPQWGSRDIKRAALCIKFSLSKLFKKKEEKNINPFETIQLFLHSWGILYTYCIHVSWSCLDNASNCVFMGLQDEWAVMWKTHLRLLFQTPKNVQSFQAQRCVSKVDQNESWKRIYLGWRSLCAFKLSLSHDNEDDMHPYLSLVVNLVAVREI